VPPEDAKQKRPRATKSRKSHAERALSSIRVAKRGQREITDPADRVRILLAEANILALLDVADALSPLPAPGEKGTGAAPAADD
jgi:hypothetical protein